MPWLELLEEDLYNFLGPSRGFQVDSTFYLLSRKLYQKFTKCIIYPSKPAAPTLEENIDRRIITLNLWTSLFKGRRNKQSDSFCIYMKLLTRMELL